MFRILVADDSDAKIAKIAGAIDSIVSGVGASVDYAATSAEATQLLREHRYDVLLLDLMMPIRDGERPDPYGGSAVLQAIRTNRVARPIHVVLLSAYPELEEAYRETAEQESWVILHYDSFVEDWIRKLGVELVGIADAGNRNRGGYEYDLAIITALHQVEFEAILDWPASWKEHKLEGDDAIYFRGALSVGAGSARVVAAAATEVGMPASTALSMKVIQRFRPRYIAMTGIAAGVEGNFGDILVADHCWDYGSGKILGGRIADSRFAPAPRSIQLDPSVHYMVNVLQLEPEILDRIQRSWTTEAPNPLQVRVGGLASGASVVQSRAVVEEILSHDRKLVGVEMEAYGVFLAAKASTEPRPAALAMKSICDFADASKNDDYQRYAAYTSAQYLLELASRYLVAR